MILSLIRFSSDVNPEMTERLSGGWDWPLSDCSSLENFVKHSMDEGNVCYWVLGDGEPVGVLELCRYSEVSTEGLPLKASLSQLVDLGMFVHRDYRGLGIADCLLHSSVRAVEQIGLYIVASVHEGNARSLGMMRRSSKFIGARAFEPNRNRYAWVFDFSDIRLETVLSDPTVVSSIVADGDEIAKLIS